MKKLLMAVAFAAIVTGFLAGCTTTNDPSEVYRGENSKEIYQKGKSALESGGYTEAIKRFEALDVQYPYGAETERAQLYLIYAYYKKEEFALAANAAERFIRVHPASANVDYAYYMQGLSDYYQNLGVIERFFSVDLATRDLRQIQKSYRDFKVLVTRFPHSKYTPSAHQYLVYLRNIMANHEYDVAKYYYEHKAYIAAANRASDVVQHYQGAPSVVDSLVLMADSYHKLGMEQYEKDTIAVLKLNYPNAKIDFKPHM